MAPYRRRPKKFKIPFNTFKEDLAPYLDSKTVVISFFGLSSYGAKSCKVELVDDVLGFQVFKQTVVAEPPDMNSETLSYIEGCYSSSKKVLFLHLIGMYDTYSLVKQIQKCKEKITEKGYLAMWAELKHTYARALLFLFHISHILVMHHPNATLDPSCSQLFRVLDTIRLDILPAVREVMAQIPGVSSYWATTGRFCTPPVLWFFEKCPPAFRKGIASKLGAKVTEDTYKSVERNFEKHISKLLRSSEVLRDDSTSLLFAIPHKKDFVFMVFEEDPTKEWIPYLVNSMIDIWHDDDLGSAESDFSCGFGNPCNFDEPYSYESAYGLAFPQQTTEQRFRAFLQKHIDDVFTPTGFGDCHHVNLDNPVETPSLGVLLEAANALDQLIVRNDPVNTTAMIKLKEKINTEMRFSEDTCSRALSLAVEAYFKNQLTSYTEEQHIEKVKHAVEVFKDNARGKLMEGYIRNLETEFRRHWQDGRQKSELKKPKTKGGSKESPSKLEDPKPRSANYQNTKLTHKRVPKKILQRDSQDQDIEPLIVPPFIEGRDYQREGAILRIRTPRHMGSTDSGPDRGTSYMDLAFPPLPPLRPRPRTRPPLPPLNPFPPHHPSSRPGLPAFPLRIPAGPPFPPSRRALSHFPPDRCHFPPDRRPYPPDRCPLPPFPLSRHPFSTFPPCRSPVSGVAPIPSARMTDDSPAVQWVTNAVQNLSLGDFVARGFSSSTHAPKTKSKKKLKQKKPDE